MKKTLRLEIDRASWSSVLPKYKKSCPFAANQIAARIDFLRAMLWIGVMSVPIQIPRWWLASQWAVLRYIAAADHGNQRLRLHPAIDDLESHHKTVLSDDWGVGLSLQWLDARLKYKHIVHGAFAMRALRLAGLARYGKRRKRGPSKCPDFFAVDRQSKIHLIECKGNQAGPSHIEKQFKHGRKQKRNIRFENESLVAQRLLCGVAIASQRSSWESTLKVADPPPREEYSAYEVLAENIQPIADTFKKVLFVQGLIAAGAGRLAHRLYPLETAAEEQGQINEIRTNRFEVDGKDWEGLAYEMRFPSSVSLGHGEVARGCRMRFGVGSDILARIKVRNGETKDTPIEGLDFDLWSGKELNDLDEAAGANENLRVTSVEISRRASIRQGSVFLADLELL